MCLSALRINSFEFTGAANTVNPHTCRPAGRLEAVSNTVAVVLPTKQSLLLGTVSQWSAQTAEHSHFTLPDLSRAVFTPVAAPAHSEPPTPAPWKHMQSPRCTRPAKQRRLWTIWGKLVLACKKRATVWDFWILVWKKVLFFFPETLWHLSFYSGLDDDFNGTGTVPCLRDRERAPASSCWLALP